MSDTEEYCRKLEAYLCRKNDGHLIRIVGPAFEQVCGWAARGVPLNVACRGIDRYFERYYAKGPRRRPVRIEFCEADVLDVFDEWRRATGVAMWGERGAAAGATEESSPGEPGAARRGPSLAEHLERVIARLTALRAGAERGWDEQLELVTRELDAARGGARSLRGAAREALLERLRTLDTQLLQAVRSRASADALRDLQKEAETELAPFKDRMPSDAYAPALQACVDRLVRERARLPILTLDR